MATAAYGGSWQFNRQDPEDWGDVVLHLNSFEGTTPLAAISQLIPKRSTESPHFNWIIKPEMSISYDITASLTVSATAMTVKKGTLANLGAGDYLFIPITNETVRITAIPSSTSTTATLTIIRGQLGTTAKAISAANIAANPAVFPIEGSMVQGSMAPASRSFGITPFSSYTEIIRTAYGVTKTAAATTSYRGMMAMNQQRLFGMERQNITMENHMLWQNSQKGTDSKGQEYTTMQGIIPLLVRENRVSTLTESFNDSQFYQIMETIFALGYGGSRMCFCGTTARTAFERYLMSQDSIQYQWNRNVRVYGFLVDQLMTHFGTINLKTHQLFSRGGSGSMGTDAWLLAIDPKMMEYRYLKGQDLRREVGLQQNGEHIIKEGFAVEMGLSWGHPNYHTLIKGVTS